MPSPHALFPLDNHPQAYFTVCGVMQQNTCHWFGLALQGTLHPGIVAQWKTMFLKSHHLTNLRDYVFLYVICLRIRDLRISRISRKIRT